MAQWLLDTFTGAAGTIVGGTSYVGEKGAAWTLGSGFGGTIDNTGGRIYGNTGAGTSIVSSGAPATDNEIVEMTFDVVTAQRISLHVRFNSSPLRGYAIDINAANTSIALQRQNPWTNLGGAKAITLLATGNVLRVKVSGTGASVLIEYALNGTTWTFTDTAANRVVELGKTNIEFGPLGAGPNSLGSNTTGVHVSSITGTDDAAAGDTVKPTATAAVVANANPTNVAVTLSEVPDPAYVPAASSMTIGGHTVSAVSFSGVTMNLTVDAFVNGEAARTLSYTKPATNGVRDAAGNQMDSFSNLAITNNVAAAATDTTAPSLVSAQVINSKPDEVVLTMSEVLAGSPPPASAFPVSGGRTVTGVTYAGNLVKLAVNLPYKQGDVITAGFTQPGTDPRMKDASNNIATSFNNQPVTNNVLGRSFTSDESESSGTIRKNQMSYWTWFPRGVVGEKMDNPIHGATMLNAQGKLVATGLIDGPGLLVQRFVDVGFPDGIYYQQGVAA